MSQVSLYGVELCPSFRQPAVARGGNSFEGFQKKSDKWIQPCPESGHDCLMCSEFDSTAEQLQGYLTHKKLPPPRTLQ